MRAAFVAALVALALAVEAQAAGAVIPRPIQSEMRSILDGIGADDLAYMPTYAPKGYRYSTFGGTATESHITLSPGGTGDPRTLYFTMAPYGRRLSDCGEGRGHKLTVAGKTVYWTTGIAWRCLRPPSGHLVVVKIHGAGLTKKALTAVAASAQRIPE